MKETYIYPEVPELHQYGVLLHQGFVNVVITRSMFDGKMAGILSGTGGAHCQLCTANFNDLHDLDLVQNGFPINRSITAAKEIFSEVHGEEFYLILPLNDLV